MVSTTILLDVDCMINSMLCPEKTEDCYFATCENCPSFEIIEKLEHILPDTIKYRFWEVKERNQIQLHTVEAEKSNFIETYKIWCCKMMKHLFVHRKQKTFIKELKEEVIKSRTSAVVVTVDFGQNYTCVTQDAIQCKFFPFHLAVC